MPFTETVSSAKQPFTVNLLSPASFHISPTIEPAVPPFKVSEEFVRPIFEITASLPALGISPSDDQYSFPEAAPL